MRKRKQYVGRDFTFATVLISVQMERLIKRIFRHVDAEYNVIAQAVATVSVEYDVEPWIKEVGDKTHEFFTTRKLDVFNDAMKEIGRDVVGITNFRLFGLHVMHFIEDGFDTVTAGSDPIFNGLHPEVPDLLRVRGGRMRRKTAQVLSRLTAMEKAWAEFEKISVPRDKIRLYEMFPDANPRNQ